MKLLEREVLGRVGELTQLAGHEIGGSLTDVHSIVSDTLQAAADDNHEAGRPRRPPRW